MDQAAPNIISGGAKTDRFTVMPLSAVSAEKHSLDIAYTVKNEEQHTEIMIKVTYTLVVADQPVSLTLEATTVFYLTYPDRHFPEQVTGPTTVAVFSELTQTALAHTRVFAMLAAAREGFRMLMPYQPMAQIEETVRASLLSSLN